MLGLHGSVFTESPSLEDRSSASPLHRYVATPFLLHTEQYDAFQIPYDIGHGYPFSSSELRFEINVSIACDISKVHSMTRPQLHRQLAPGAVLNPVCEHLDTEPCLERRLLPALRLV